MATPSWVGATLNARAEWGSACESSSARDAGQQDAFRTRAHRKSGLHVLIAEGLSQGRGVREGDCLPRTSIISLALKGSVLHRLPPLLTAEGCALQQGRVLGRQGACHTKRPKALHACRFQRSGGGRCWRPPAQTLLDLPAQPANASDVADVSWARCSRSGFGLHRRNVQEKNDKIMNSGNRALWSYIDCPPCLSFGHRGENASILRIGN